MESFLDSTSFSSAPSASCSTPQTPSPPMEDSYTGLVEPSAQYYLEYQQAVPILHQHHQPPIQSQFMDNSHPSATASAPAGPLYRRASFPFVHHDHPMSPYPKLIAPDAAYVPEHHHHHLSQDQYEYDEHAQASAMVVPTQLPQVPHHSAQGFYRPSSSSSSVSSVSGAPSSYLNPGLSSIPVMHTDDAASKETQYLRRKCFNCGTTEPPSWRRSTLNPGKIVCNKCGLYERTHNKPRPHQFGLRPGNKARKQQHPTHYPQPGKMHHGSSPSSSPKRHGLSVKKEPLDYSQAMRRGSIASINSGSGTSDWEDHSGYSTASSAYPSSLGMAPPPQQHHHSLSHHHSHQSHVPPHHHHHHQHAHHPYNIMPPPRSTSAGIRLPQAPPMKVPTKPGGSSSPVTATGTTGAAVPGNLNSSGSLSNSPDGLHPSSAHNLIGSPYSGVPTLAPNPSVQSIYGNNGILRGPSGGGIPSPDYYARRGSTSQIPQHSSSQYDHLAMMRRGSVGAIGMGMTGMSFGEQTGPRPPLPNMSGWQSQQQAGNTALNGTTSTSGSTTNAPMPGSLSEMSVTPAPAPGGGYNSADSTPRHSYGTGDLTPSPPQQQGQMPMLRGGSSPLGGGIPPEIASLAV